MKVERVGAALLIALASPFAGCGAPVNRLQIESHKPPAPPSTLTQKFPEAWFSWDPRGNIDLVFESAQPSEVDSDEQMLQVFWARMFW